MQVKLDPIGYLLIAAVLGIQIYATFVRKEAKSTITGFVEENDAMYQRAVFDDDGTKGIMQQVFRQNEINRELLKATLVQCSR